MHLYKYLSIHIRMTNTKTIFFFNDDHHFTTIQILNQTLQACDEDD
jgi:hypothetical protein